MNSTRLDFTDYELELLYNELRRIFFLPECCKILRIIEVTHNPKTYLSFTWLIVVDCRREGISYTNFNTYGSPRSILNSALYNIENKSRL